jgi:hypothetical protein
MSDEQSVKTQSLDDVLKTMKRVQETFVYEIWVPSLKNVVRFKEINTAQQKRLVKTVIDSEVYKTEFIKALRDIIAENCADDIDIDELTILDKLCIAIHMRSISVGNELDLEIPIPGDESNSMKYSIKLDEVLDNIKNKVKSPSIKEIEDENGKFKVTCNVPKIGTEYKLEQELRTTVDNEEITDVNKLRELLGDVFTSELCKYISVLKIKDDNEMVINLDNVTFTDRIRLIEELPVKLIKEVLAYIEKIKEEINKITLIKVEYEGNKIERRLEVDSGFFTNF